MYSNTLYSCKDKNLYSKPFLANQGVKQGDSLSPVLFNIFIDDIKECFNTKLSDSVKLSVNEFNHLLYADDLVLISETSTGLQHCIDCLQKYSMDWRLDLNFKKTKIIVFTRKISKKDKYFFYYGPFIIEIVQNYKYLGVLFNYNGKFHEAASNLADKARKAYFALKSKLIYNNNLSIKTWLSL